MYFCFQGRDSPQIVYVTKATNPAPAPAPAAAASPPNGFNISPGYSSLFSPTGSIGQALGDALNTSDNVLNTPENAAKKDWT